MRHVLPICNNNRLGYTNHWREGFMLISNNHVCFSARSYVISRLIITCFAPSLIWTGNVVSYPPFLHISPYYTTYWIEGLLLIVCNHEHFLMGLTFNRILFGPTIICPLLYSRRERQKWWLFLRPLWNSPHCTGRQREGALRIDYFHRNK